MLPSNAPTILRHWWVQGLAGVVTLLAAADLAQENLVGIIKATFVVMLSIGGVALLVTAVQTRRNKTTAPPARTTSHR